MSHSMGKPTICIGENKGADQLRSRHFHYIVHQTDRQLLYQSVQRLHKYLIRKLSFQSTLVVILQKQCP